MNRGVKSMFCSRVFLFSTCVFPHGSASANYLQYLGQALLTKYSKVVLVSYGNKKDCEYNASENEYTYRGITFECIEYRNKFSQKVTEKCFLGRNMLRYIRKYKPVESDYFIVYSSDKMVLSPILDYAEKKNIKTAACIVEWFPENLYNGKSYRQYNEVFEKLYTKFDRLFPISTYIAQRNEVYLEKSFVLPILTDVHEYPLAQKRRKSNTRRKFIMIANGMMKDQISSVYEMISCMSDKELENSEFHFKGIKEKELQAVLPQVYYKQIGKSIFTHGWMSYDELMQLYQDMDFLLLPRETNQMTLANFPSKVPEIMRFGVIPIVSNVGDYTNKYLKSNENALIMQGCDAEICYEAVKQAIYMEEERLECMSKNARISAEKLFDYRNWSDSISQTLEQLK